MPLALRHTDIRIQAERVWLDALLSSAPDVKGLLICATPYVTRLRDSREALSAGILREYGYGTLVVSMLTPYEESRDPDVRYDVSMLGHRLQALIAWIEQQPDLEELPLGLLAVDTVAAAAIRYLVREPERIGALVSRAGRADLAGADPLRRLRTPTLMLVPEAEPNLSHSSAQAYQLLGSEKVWQTLGHTSATLIEPGALEASAHAAAEWFTTHLPMRATGTNPQPAAPASPEPPFAP